MPTRTLSKENQSLYGATQTAINKLRALQGKPGTEAVLVRSIIYDIGADAMMSLPVPFQAVVPQSSKAIIGDQQLSLLIKTLIDNNNALT